MMLFLQGVVSTVMNAQHPTGQCAEAAATDSPTDEPANPPLPLPKFL